MTNLNNVISRLVAFGDSFTEGCGLDDQFETLSKGKPSQCPYPALLGNMLNVPVSNMGKYGSSNLEILTSILSFKFQPNDVVLIGWTYTLRDMLFKKSSNIDDSENHIRLYFGAPKGEPKEMQSWLKLHNDYDLSVRTGLYIHHADIYLQSIGVKVIHFSAIHHDWYIRLMKTHQYPIWIKEPRNKFYKNLFPRLDLGIDNSHPGVKSQKKLADNLLKIIEEEIK
tara:strand:- start:200 stop:874 length:675 start_codon:yes stop_codon:yes gene_type:complete